MRLDEIARAAGLRDAAVAFGKLCGDEFRRGSLHDFTRKLALHRIEERAVAENKTRLEKRGANGHVRARINETLVDRPSRMPNLLAEIPKHIEDRLAGV